MRPRLILFASLTVVILCLLASAAYMLPPVRARLAWRVDNLVAQVQRKINPPEEVVFVPQGSVDEIVQATLRALSALTPSPTFPLATDTPAPAQPGPTETPVPSVTPTLTPTPLPAQTILSGVRHEYQQMNNCGPATLSMALSYWGWQGDQRDTRLGLRPNFNVVDDKNVNPYEMVAFVSNQPGMQALARFGGDLETIKRLVAAGFPVMVEKGHQDKPRDWMGHYVLITGYEDERERVITQDSLIMADLPVKYDVLQEEWRAFNDVYLVIYAADRHAELQALLGMHADPIFNLKEAAKKAQIEAEQLSGRDLFFVYYNLGTSLTALQEYPAAAAAYDQAFSLYPEIPENDRPWRMLWYQTGPYEAYFHTGRYEDVIELGNQTLNTAGGPILEESFFWLGKAREAQGDLEKAIYDYKKAMEINPDSTPARDELARLGVAYP